MPIVRYIAWVGTSLLALLFVVNWFLPESLPEPAHEAIEKPVIRIASIQQLPERLSGTGRIRPLADSKRATFRLTSDAKYCAGWVVRLNFDWEAEARRAKVPAAGACPEAL
jgi:hypothetical protein